MTMGTYIPLNGILVEVGRHDAETAEQSTARLGAIMSVAMVWRSVGSLGASLLHLLLVRVCSNRSLLLVVCIQLTLVILVMLWVPTALFAPGSAPQHHVVQRVRAGWGQFRRSCNPRNLRSDGFVFFLVLCFVFVYTTMPDGSTSYMNYTFSAFSLSSGVLSLSSTCGSIGSIVGAYVFSVWMKRRAAQEERGKTPTSMFTIFFLGSVAWAFGYVTNLLLCTGFVTDVLHIAPAVYIPVDSFFVSMFVRFAFMPTLTMAAEHAPKHLEATTFEVFSVVCIVGGTCSALLTSVIAEALGITKENYGPLSTLIVLSIICKLLPIPIAYILPKRDAAEESTDVVVEREEVVDGEA
ncbi:folate/biopterin transporter [Strigomonas culicis]|uniref:Folate/biopterin transporter n=2 Tax=Strigomonas culicis TaxID=28005 RepID=S9W2I6_9TRYP|nr:folate/biopterin transporter [Strigomonas culicis]|eukprot:EPY30080.1 folate/biopterin transporter [Strigomonas culicis]